jgi:hypothetical protein
VTLRWYDRKNLLVVTYHRHICIPELSSLFKTPAYNAGVSNAYYARLEPAGLIRNMPAIQNEVLYAMQPELAPTEAAAPAKFGAKDVFDLSWRNLLDAYSCTECGRCTCRLPG